MEKLETSKEFDFTVIMAVYNVEPFLKEAVLSLLSQDIGFEEHVQLILVDDGSTDGSGKICDTFADFLPENILVIHQENAGVSAARNAGIPHIKGKYVNFLDADDKLSVNALSKVYSFFSKYGDKVNLVSLPLRFFGARNGSHVLNQKFNKGTRLVDLLREPDKVQMHVSSSFVRYKSIKGIYFDTKLTYAEDSKFVITVLLQQPMLGLVSEACYYYRRRSEGEASAIDQCESNAKWYLPTIKYFSKDIFEASKTIYGSVLPFVQHYIMHDLQWRLITIKKMVNVLTRNEINEYCSVLYSLLQDIDDNVILTQKNIWQEQKVFLWKKKHGINPELRLNASGDDFDLYLSDENPYFVISRCMTVYEFLKIDEERDTITLEGYTTLIGISEDEEVNLYLRVNGQKDILCTPVKGRNVSREVLGEIIMPAYPFICTIENVSSYANKGIGITLVTELRGVKFTRSHNLRSGQFFPLGRDFKTAYAEIAGWFIRFGEDEHIVITKVDHEAIVAREEMLLLEMEAKGKSGKDAVRRRRLTRMLKPFFKKEIWLVSDRINKADDNGEAFFTYLQAHKEIDKYFVISSDSSDYDRLMSIGKIVDYLSEEHLLLFLMADRIISSAGDAYVMNPFGGEWKFYRDIINRKQQIFLQHGVILHDLSGWLNRFDKNFSMFVTTAVSENDSILNGSYFYDDNIVKLTGLSRHDRLENRTKKQIVIMPTWRKSLNCYALAGSAQYALDGLKHYSEKIKESTYFQYYNSLINHSRLIESAMKNGYDILFMPHPNLQPYEKWFNHQPSVKFCSIDTKYSGVISESSLAVTDYSSVVFDFAYMRKPIVYTQYDREEFFKEHFDFGYFDYERDGFGEVEYDLDHTVDRIIEYMENGCQLKEKYRERIEKFFGFHDRNNCQRTFEAIMSLSQPESFTAWQTEEKKYSEEPSLALLSAAAKSRDNEALRVLTPLSVITPPSRRDHLRYIFPSHLFKEGERVAIYAAGEVGTEFFRQAKLYGYVDPVMIVDRNAASMQPTADLPVQPVDALLQEDEYDSILIAIRFERIAGPVKRDLMAMGIPEEKIKWDGEVYFADDWGKKFWKRKVIEEEEA